MTACPFCHISLDKSGKHFCTAIREQRTFEEDDPLYKDLPTAKAIECTECQVSFGDSASLTQHIKANHMQPQKSEIERIIEVLAWAHEKGALHFKCPYFEMVFPPNDERAANLPTPEIIDDNARAEAGLRNPEAVPFKNPIDDPDYYADAQDKFFNHQAQPNRR